MSVYGPRYSVTTGSGEKSRQLHASAPEPPWQTQDSNQTAFPTQLSPWKPFTPLRSRKRRSQCATTALSLTEKLFYNISTRWKQCLLREGQMVECLSFCGERSDPRCQNKIILCDCAQRACGILLCVESPLQVMRLWLSHRSWCDSTSNIVEFARNLFILF